MKRLSHRDPVLVQAVIAGALSFAHLHDIAQAAGQDGWKGWAYPISVDLLLVAAWRRLRSGHGARLGWVWFLIALVASLGANVATAGFLDLAHPPAWLRMLVAGWPAAAFLGGTLLAHTPGPSATEPAPEPAPALLEPLAPEPEPAPVDPEPQQAIDPPESGQRDRQESDSAPQPVQAAPAAAPAALIAHARKVADVYKATTGQPIDTDTLRARLGVPAPMAEAIATQLT
ncbi:DUF2637 domain-containing protein [Streptomyces cinnamoneus]|uniref:SpdA2 protein n=1 Tax=Streptomyces cinnamoneus TaxID=53446 RepID=A0A918TL06_STRCJ|nr:DUF2637 domain-containing protein [Streptomyces cinnamoneus]GHC52363.1 SpdA2 protein [Streptomyces cinnamoneus]